MSVEVGLIFSASTEIRFRIGASSVVISEIGLGFRVRVRVRSRVRVKVRVRVRV